MKKQIVLTALLLAALSAGAQETVTLVESNYADLAVTVQSRYPNDYPYIYPLGGFSYSLPDGGETVTRCFFVRYCSTYNSSGNSIYSYAYYPNIITTKDFTPNARLKKTADGTGIECSGNVFNIIDLKAGDAVTVYTTVAPTEVQNLSEVPDPVSSSLKAGSSTYTVDSYTMTVEEDGNACFTIPSGYLGGITVTRDFAEGKGTYVANGFNANPQLEATSNGNQSASAVFLDTESLQFSINSDNEKGSMINSYVYQSQKTITVDGTAYTPIEMGSATYSFSKSDNIRKVTMYAWYNQTSGSADISDADGNIIFTANGFNGELTSADITDYDRITVNAGTRDSIYAVFVIDFSDEDNDDNGPSTAIETITADDTSADYYNLQGRKVTKPASGIYIKNSGGKSTKIIL